MATLCAPATPENASLRDRVVEHLAAVPIFEALEPEQLEALASAAQLVNYAPGETIFKAGEPGTTLHVVLEGTVRLLAHEGDGGPPRLAATREPGQCYGEIGFLTGQPRHMTALNGPEAGHHVVVDRRMFEKLVQSHPAVGQVVMTALVDTLVRRMENLPPYVRDYLVWGHRPRPAAPPAMHTISRPQLFAVAGMIWGALATGLLLMLESWLEPGIVRTITSMGVTLIALSTAGCLCGLALGALAQHVDPRA